MPHVDFKFNIKEDARNYFEAINSTPHWGYDFSKSVRPELREKIKGKKWNDVKDYLVNLLKKGYAQDNEKNKKKLLEIKSTWKKVETDYFKKLEKITKKKIYTKDFTCYITTIGRCPYDKKENWFMVNLFHSTDKIITTCAHELMHLQFHHYFENNLRKKLSKEQFENLKESLTVFLNSEFRNIIKSKDMGYPEHEHLRDFIEQTWKHQKDFDVLLGECINELITNQ